MGHDCPMKSVVALLLLFSPGTAEARADQSPPVAIAYEEVGPWGTYRLTWRVEASGAGVYEQSGPAPGQLEEAAIHIDPVELARLHDLLRLLDGAQQIPCPDAITDQAFGFLSWTRAGQTTTYVLDRGCESEGSRADAERIDRAIAIVRPRATGSRP